MFPHELYIGVNRAPSTHLMGPVDCASKVQSGIRRDPNGPLRLPGKREPILRTQELGEAYREPRDPLLGSRGKQPPKLECPPELPPRFLGIPFPLWLHPL